MAIEKQLSITTTQHLTLPQKEEIFRLWNNEYPTTLQYHSISEFDTYLNGLTGHNHYLLSDNNGHIYGWGFTFVRNSEKWFAIILDSSIHKQGLGTVMLNTLKANEPVLYGWVIDHNNAIKSDGTAYSSPLNFYIKNNFSLHPDTRLETEKLSAVKISWVK